MPEVSIVIVCMNRPDNLYPCLDSVFAGTKCGLEVYVVAYKYDKVSLAGAQNRYPQVHFIVSDEWRGFAENNNLALRQVQTPYTLILNDDTLVPNGLIDTLLADFKVFDPQVAGSSAQGLDVDSVAQPCGSASAERSAGSSAQPCGSVSPQRPGIIASPLYNEDGSLQFCGRKEFTASHYVRFAWHLGDLNPASFDDFEKVAIDPQAVAAAAATQAADQRAGAPAPAPAHHAAHCAGSPTAAHSVAAASPALYKVGNVSGACFMIPTALFRDLGFFDERFFFTPEDIALSVAVRRRGLAVYMDPSLRLIHKYHGSTSRIAHAIRPAEIRGCMIHLCDGKPLKYFAVGFCIWLAEATKLLKALLHRDKIKLRIYRNTTRSIFTRSLPKTLFLKYL